MRKALNIPLEEFLRPFFGPGERICLRIFDDRKTGTFKGAKLETSLSGLPGLMDIRPCTGRHRAEQQQSGQYGKYSFHFFLPPCVFRISWRR